MPATRTRKVTGKIGSMLPPGREVDGKLISRSVLWLNLSASVSSQTKNPEACYLFLQWLGSSRIYAWMTANPGGYFDPFRLSDFSDPLVRQTYHAYHMDVVRETVARTVPTINYPGATAFHNALDENLVAALTKAKTRRAGDGRHRDASGRRIARRTGEDKLLEAIKTNKEAWPTVTRSDRLNLPSQPRRRGGTPSGIPPAPPTDATASHRRHEAFHSLRDLPLRGDPRWRWR